VWAPHSIDFMLYPVWMTDEVQALLVDFESALSREGLATRGRYVYEVKNFVLWMEGRTGTAFVPAAVTRADVRIYCLEVLERRKRSGTWELVTMLRRFFACMREVGVVEASQIEELGWSDVEVGVPLRDAAATEIGSRREGWRELEKLEERLERACERPGGLLGTGTPAPSVNDRATGGPSGWARGGGDPRPARRPPFASVRPAGRPSEGGVPTAQEPRPKAVTERRNSDAFSGPAQHHAFPLLESVIARGWHRRPTFSNTESQDRLAGDSHGQPEDADGTDRRADSDAPEQEP